LKVFNEINGVEWIGRHHMSSGILGTPYVKGLGLPFPWAQIFLARIFPKVFKSEISE
jgi:hypothetical protein